jgi:hypothetical protein
LLVRAVERGGVAIAPDAARVTRFTPREERANLVRSPWSRRPWASCTCRGGRRRRESVLGLYWIQFFDPRKYRENWQSPKRFCNPSHGTLRYRFSGFPRGKRWISACSEVAFISRVSPVQVRPPLVDRKVRREREKRSLTPRGVVRLPKGRNPVRTGFAYLWRFARCLIARFPLFVTTRPAASPW